MPEREKLSKGHGCKYRSQILACDMRAYQTLFSNNFNKEKFFHCTDKLNFGFSKSVNYVSLPDVN